MTWLRWVVHAAAFLWKHRVRNGQARINKEWKRFLKLWWSSARHCPRFHFITPDFIKLRFSYKQVPDFNISFAENFQPSFRNNVGDRGKFDLKVLKRGLQKRWLSPFEKHPSQDRGIPDTLTEMCLEHYQRKGSPRLPRKCKRVNDSHFWWSSWFACFLSTKWWPLQDVTRMSGIQLHTFYRQKMPFPVELSGRSVVSLKQIQTSTP